MKGGVFMDLGNISTLLFSIAYLCLALRCRKYRKENEELKRAIERMPYEMCLNSDKSE